MLDWKQLVRESNQQLASHDIAEIHFAIAAGLPGAERIDVPTYRMMLDQYAWQISKTTEGLWRVFEEEPEKFGNSRASFRLLVMTTVIQRDLGFRSTDKLNRDDPDASDSRDLFLHGLLEGQPGNCSNLPVLYAAIGRRLNYPIRLVTRPIHLFARWDEPGGERVNLECATRNGFFSPSDEYCLRWPKHITPAELFGTYFMKSLTPREELSGFLIQRAFCLLHNGRHREAVESACYSHELAPHHQLHLATLQRLIIPWQAKLAQQGCNQNLWGSVGEGFPVGVPLAGVSDAHEAGHWTHVRLSPAGAASLQT